MLVSFYFQRWKNIHVMDVIRRVCALHTFSPCILCWTRSRCLNLLPSAFTDTEERVRSTRGYIKSDIIREELCGCCFLLHFESSALCLCIGLPLSPVCKKAELTEAIPAVNSRSQRNAALLPLFLRKRFQQRAMTAICFLFTHWWLEVSYRDAGLRDFWGREGFRRPGRRQK